MQKTNVKMHLHKMTVLRNLPLQHKKPHTCMDLRRIVFKKQMEVCIFFKMKSEVIGNSLQSARQSR